jgi:chromosome segregation ATPase
MNNENPEESSTIKKRFLAKQKVQEEMDELRIQIKELRQQHKDGLKVEQDIEACLGYLKVLRKEMDSIKEGVHDTFLSAKKYISPKFDYGTKKEMVDSRITSLNKEITIKNKELSGGFYETEHRENLKIELNSLIEQKQEALLELKAIEQFNHTRFMEQRAIEEKLKQEQDAFKSNMQNASSIKPSDVYEQEEIDADLSGNSDHRPCI